MNSWRTWNISTAIVVACVLQQSQRDYSETKTKKRKKKRRVVDGTERGFVTLQTGHTNFNGFYSQWGKTKNYPFTAEMHFRNSSPFPIYSEVGPIRFSSIKERKSHSIDLVVYLLEHENDIGRCFKLETSNNSINLWSVTLALAAAKRWYSSKTDVRHHLCNFLKQPTRQPVRCFPLLQWIKTGWFLTSRTTFSASRNVSCGMFTKGSRKT